MKIAVLGTGMVGRIISSRLNELGHEVSMGTRDVNSKTSPHPSDKNASIFIDWYGKHPSIVLKTFEEVAKIAEVIVNCTGGGVSLTALEAAGSENLNGKVLIDLANPLDFSNGMPPSLNPVNTDSLGEHIQRKFPEAKVVKTLNTMNAGIMVRPEQIKGDHNVFVCGNDEDAKKTVKEILGEFGWKQSQIIDLGDITNSRGTEMLLPIWLRLWNALGTAEFNFHIQRK